MSATARRPAWAAIERYASADAVASATAALVRAAIAAGSASGARFHLALAGGQTPKRMFAHLTAARDALDVSKVTWWWGDERAVPPEHPSSNYGVAREALLAPLGVAPSAVMRFHGEAADLAAAARNYDSALRATIGDPPALDLLLLGLGADGHTASWFPGSAALSALGPKAPWAMANDVDSPLAGGRATRLTITPRMALAARRLVVSVTGADKAAALARALAGPSSDTSPPAALLAGAAERVQWIIDDDAARDLPPDLLDPRR